MTTAKKVSPLARNFPAPVPAASTNVPDPLKPLLDKLDEFISKSMNGPIVIHKLEDEVKVIPPLLPGMRVNFRSKEAIMSLLEQGYLELIYLMDGRSVANVIRKDGDEPRPYSIRRVFIGQNAPAPGMSTQISADDLVKYDLHTYQWYPNDY